MKARYREVKTVSEFIDAIRLRIEVFIREQGFEPGWEPDEDDKKARHFIAIDAGKVVATARFREIESGKYKIERMVVAKDCRGSGVGAGLVDFMVARLLKLKPKAIWLRSQVQSQKFYEKCGFTAITKPFDMWNVPHIDMEYRKIRKQGLKR